jgi:hypothetical protein
LRGNLEYWDRHRRDACREAGWRGATRGTGGRDASCLSGIPRGGHSVEALEENTTTHSSSGGPSTHSLCVEVEPPPEVHEHVHDCLEVHVGPPDVGQLRATPPPAHCPPLQSPPNSLPLTDILVRSAWPLSSKKRTGRVLPGGTTRELFTTVATTGSHSPGETSTDSEAAWGSLAASAGRTDNSAKTKHRSMNREPWRSSLMTFLLGGVESRKRTQYLRCYAYSKQRSTEELTQRSVQRDGRTGRGAHNEVAARRSGPSPLISPA